MTRIEERLCAGVEADVVWPVMADFGEVGWAPFVVRSCTLTSERGQGVGARRDLRLLGGVAVHETVVAWEEGRSFTYELWEPPLPWSRMRETWAVEPEGRSAEVRVSIEYSVGGGVLGAVLDRLLFRPLLRWQARAALRGLTRHAQEVRSREARMSVP